LVFLLSNSSRGKVTVPTTPPWKVHGCPRPLLAVIRLLFFLARSLPGKTNPADDNEKEEYIVPGYRYPGAQKRLRHVVYVL
jgi:hypothetical protein